MAPKRKIEQLGLRFTLKFIVVSSAELRFRIEDPKHPTNNNSHIGYASVYFEGRWGSICAVDTDSWTNANARVFCRSLGFVDGVTT